MKISSVNLTALILLHILISCSSSCLGDVVVSSGETDRIAISRKVLSSSVASFSAGNGAAVKEPKKAVLPSLRKAPPSVPNPTQN
ncbi:Emsy N Terminus/ plant Tudor-like domains-containing protein isoform 1 [Hibiscus syriacus]|uniref:Emsy N Terminus/ plant Tudor-like domains-containing protein isoform 1 n=1 Tax=Hibiscus syriacus TaxID=106335 RepID=A0A6A2YML8_HIBSY|nr:Emsy N Terminus/ plant Tudor-like domains-containing protein isoform 1 [Hibiscus syriacus]